MKSVLYILATALILAAFTYLLTLLGLFGWDRHFLINLGFLVFLTVVADVINQKALDQEGRGVIIPYIISIIVKLIFSAVFLILFVKANLNDARAIVFSFLAYYAVFSTAEIVLVNKRLRVKKF